MLQQLLDIFLHLDKHLAEFVTQHGPWAYGLLFIIIFCETGLVITPFLPGDSLLFAAGALAANGTLNLWLAAAVITVAAILGDAVNYAIGRALADRVLSGKRIPFVKPEHIRRTHDFFERYGPKTIVIARFVPIVRTFAPFVAGVGKMTYARFALYNVVGALAWVLVCVGAGYFFGNFEIVKKNFELVVLAIIAISILPMVVEFFLARRRARLATGAGGNGDRSAQRAAGGDPPAA